MEGSKGEMSLPRFNGKNFALWEFQFRLHCQGKRMLSILDGTAAAPADNASQKDKDDWAVKNAAVMSWLCGSVDPGIALSLRGFSTASEMWGHLAKLYAKVNASRKFDVEQDLAQLKQGDLTISAYYQEAVTLWTEQDLIFSSLATAPPTSDTIRERMSTQVMRVLMNLRAEFENIRASLLHRDVSAMEDVLAELLREETRIKSQAKLDIHSSDSGAAFAVGGKPQFHRNAKGEILCFNCKSPRHIQFHCPKPNTCNYCKQDGHIIAVCPTLAQRNRSRSNGARHGPPRPAVGGAYAANAWRDCSCQSWSFFHYFIDPRGRSPACARGLEGFLALGFDFCIFYWTRGRGRKSGEGVRRDVHTCLIIILVRLRG